MRALAMHRSVLGGFKNDLIAGEAALNPGMAVWRAVVGRLVRSMCAYWKGTEGLRVLDETTGARGLTVVNKWQLAHK
jgi:hypothetical protein